MDGETYECVKRFCCLGDTLGGDGGTDLAATASIGNEWITFREFLLFLTFRVLHNILEMKVRVYQLCQRLHDLWK